MRRTMLSPTLSALLRSVSDEKCLRRTSSPPGVHAPGICTAYPPSVRSDDGSFIREKESEDRHDDQKGTFHPKRAIMAYSRLSSTPIYAVGRGPPDHELLFLYVFSPFSSEMSLFSLRIQQVNGMRTRKASDISVTSKTRDLRDFEWHQRLTRRLEQALNVHPEKYNGVMESRSNRVSRNPTPVDVECRNRAHSEDLAPIMDTDEINGNLLSMDDKSQSPQRGTPLTDDSMSPRGSGELITINVSGMRFQTWQKTLERYPDSLLGNRRKREKYWIPENREYFFDRYRPTFESILYIYQSRGRVKRPETVPIDIFLRELKFFQMGDELAEEFWIAEGYEKPADTIMPSNPTQRKLWELIEYPDSSLSARIVAFISIAAIVVSIVSFCWETVPGAEASTTSATPEKEEGRHFYNPFFWVELICILWFTIELFLRFISCPSKYTFLTSFLNIIDFVAIAPFFVNVIWADASKSNSSMSFAVLRVLRLVRVFRIFKLSRHSVGLQILGKTFRASVQEFCLLIFFMAIALVLFSSGMYFAEQGEPNSKFTSIPASFWFVLVTMTTVGYGDLVPLSPQGKIVGSMCALIGVLTLALPVPIIVANFKHFYRQENRLATMRTAGKDPKDPDDVEAGEDS